MVATFVRHVEKWGRVDDMVAWAVHPCVSNCVSCVALYSFTGGTAKRFGLQSWFTFRYLMREHRAEIEFNGNVLQSLVARPDGDAVRADTKIRMAIASSSRP